MDTPIISVMLAVLDTPRAIDWYKNALGATELWNFGSVAGLEIAGAPIFLGEPANNGWESPEKLGITSTRVEVFCDDPDAFITRAVEAGANGSFDTIRNHETPWGIHRQGGFIDPFGHIWLVGDRVTPKPFLTINPFSPVVFPNIPNFANAMAKTEVPLFKIQQHCSDSGIPDFKVGSFTQETCTAVEFEENHRHEYFEIIWLKNGTGIHCIDLKDHAYVGSVMFMLAPGQVHKIEQQIPSEGYIIKFLPSVFNKEKDFFDYVLDTCLFDSNSSCSVIKVPPNIQLILEELFLRMTEEFKQIEGDTENIVSSYLKILITHINRIKKNNVAGERAIIDAQYALFRQFKIAIEKNYKREHSVQYYAGIMNTLPRTLNAVSRKYAGKSAGELIQDRILLEAQRSLYHETKSVKEICFDLGFEDPAYFTRFFKKHTGYAPQFFKEQRTAAPIA